MEGLPGALADLRVLDLAGEPGAYCGKLLADLGADVIKVEPPGGDPARRIGPFFHDDVHPEKSLYFFAFNTSKRSITLDIARADGRALLRRLVERADVLLETFPPGYMEDLGLGYETLRQLNPRLIYCSITGFGLWGPHAHYRTSDLIALAMSGVMYLAGFPEDPPNRPYGNQAYYCGSIQACSGILTALAYRDRTGQGQMVEVSLQEALAMNQETAMQYWDLRRELRRRQGEGRRLPDGQWFRVPGIGTYQCADGYVFLMVGVPGFGAPLATLIQWMAEEGEAEGLTSPKWVETFSKLDLRLVTQLLQGADASMAVDWLPRFRHVDAIIERFVRSRPKQLLYQEGQRRGLLVAPVNTPKDVVEDPQLNARGFFQDVPHEELGILLRYPGSPYRLYGSPARIWRRPPRIGEHNREVYIGELGLTTEQLAALSAAGVV
ncbi:Succinyl-CoA:(R)-benzylsuccinate CoA-transferase subunit BbsE [bacterium HR25]|nr:Succinyl-CoA:(R)-benzylsuccinate CoA-transferase subunit BbsE [bacterium HR25]